MKINKSADGAIWGLKITTWGSLKRVIAASVSLGTTR